MAPRCPTCGGEGLLLLRTVLPCNRCDVLERERHRPATGLTSAELGPARVRYAPMFRGLTVPAGTAIAVGFDAAMSLLVARCLNAGRLVDGAPRWAHASYGDRENWAWSPATVAMHLFGDVGGVADFGPDRARWVGWIDRWDAVS